MESASLLFIGKLLLLYMAWTLSINLILKNFHSLDMWGTIMKTYIEVLIFIPALVVFF